MGWRGYETHIPVGMIFRKMYCHRCGIQLKKEKITKVFKRGEQGYSDDILGHPTIGMSEIAKSECIYKCPNCSNTITYDEQLHIHKLQKKLKHTILSADDFNIEVK